MKITQETLIINKAVREENMNRVGVLSQVKELLLLPNTEYATIDQLAHYFEVEVEAIQKVSTRHVKELESDGYKAFRRDDILEKLKGIAVQLVKTQGKVTVTLNDGQVIDIANRGLRLFPRRAILRVAMLLRDSKIAQEIRTQLLNIEEKTSNEVKTIDIDDELMLHAEVSKALLSGDMQKVIEAQTALNAFVNRKHKEELNDKETIIEALTTGNLKFPNPQKVVLALVRRYGSARYGSKGIGQAWGDLHRHLLYKEETGINLYSRRTNALKRGDEDATLNTVIKDEEYPIVIKAIVSLSNNIGCDVTDILKDMDELA